MWEDATCTEGDGCSVAKKTCLNVFLYLHHGDMNIPGGLFLFVVQEDAFKNAKWCQECQECLSGPKI